MTLPLEITNLGLWHKEVVLFRSFNLTLQKNDKILLKGKSGSGKSSLLKIVLGFCPYQEGKVIIQGQPLDSENARSLRQNFAYVSQNLHFRPGTIQELVSTLSSFRHNHLPGRLDPQLMETFEFSEKLLTTKTSQLSGGECQRLGIILAIMLKRPIFLLDEVTAALDENLTEKVVEYFEKTETPMIVASHDKTWEKSGAFRKVAL